MALNTQTAKLNLVPGFTTPVTVHCSTGDVGSTIRFELVNGSGSYTIPANTTVTVRGSRRDGVNFGPYNCTYSGNVVSFNLRNTMTLVGGGAIAEIVLTNSDGDVLGSSNFAIYCEDSPTAIGVSYGNDLSVYQDILTYVQNTVIPTNSVTIDKNLQISGAAADAKATGDRIASATSGLATKTYVDNAISQIAITLTDAVYTIEGVTITNYTDSGFCEDNDIDPNKIVSVMVDDTLGSVNAWIRKSDGALFIRCITRPSNGVVQLRIWTL